MPTVRTLPCNVSIQATMESSTSQLFAPMRSLALRAWIAFYLDGEVQEVPLGEINAHAASNIDSLEMRGGCTVFPFELWPGNARHRFRSAFPSQLRHLTQRNSSTSAVCNGCMGHIG